MTNKEFLIELQKSCHIEMPLCMQLISQLQKVLAKAAVDQLPVVLSELGTFTSHKHPEYLQEDSQTGAMTLYPPRITYRMQTEINDEAVSGAVLLAEYAKIEVDDASVLVHAMVEIIKAALQRGEEIEVSGIGTFSLVLTHNSELQHISFAPSDQMKELVNAPFSCFEPLVISDGVAIAEEEVETVAPVEEEFPLVAEPDPEEQDLEETIMEEPAVEAPEIEQQTEPQPVLAKTEKVYKDKGSDDWLIYVSLSLILLASGFLFCLIFGGGLSSDNKDDEVVVAKEYVDDAHTAEEIVSVDIVSTDEVVVAEDTIVTIVEPVPVIEPAPVIEPEKEEPKKEEPAPAPKPKEYHRMKGADGNPVTVTLQPGERLTIIALNQFGDKAFWPYIFDVNSDRLKAPNLVQSGMTLYLPDPAYYDINANDEASLRKAKNRGAQLLK